MNTFKSFSDFATTKLSVRFLLISATLFLSFACTKSLNPDEADGGPVGPTACEEITDCDEGYECTGGLCLRPCVSDEACPSAAEFCNNQGYCGVGCRDASGCDAEEICDEGACIPRDQAGDCTTKCDCAPGQVCSGGICDEPPAACTGPADCGRGVGDRCEAFSCNGFTSLCFDPNPEACSGAADCAARPGCQDGCDCTPNGQCVPAGGCTIETETEDCGSGFYCNNNLACEVAPACNTQDDPVCTDVGLVCNVGRGLCERAQPCTSDAECTQSPYIFCNLSVVPTRCDVPLCNNGGRDCLENEECNENSGLCQPQGFGPCQGDFECDADKYCSFATGEGACAFGCRDNAGCPQGEECSNNQCRPDGSGGPGVTFGGPCLPGAGECADGLRCTIASLTCVEECDSLCLLDPSGCCVNGGTCEFSIEAGGSVCIITP